MKNIIINKLDEKVEINIIGTIGSSFFTESYGKEEAKRDILENRDKELIINIFSEGGSFYDGVFIRDILKQHPKKVTTNVLSLAASAATIIALGGNLVRMSNTATWMIHEPSLTTSVTPNSADDIKENLDKAYSTLIQIYQSKTGMEESALRELMDGKEVFLSAEEALEMGFIDEIFESEKILSNLQHNVIDGELITNHLKNKLIDTMDVEMINDLKHSVKELSDKATELTNELDTVKNENGVLVNEKEDLEVLNSTLTESNVSLETERTELENKVQELETEKIEFYINNAVEQGRITEPQKEDYLKLANTDFEAVQNILETIPVRTKISDQLVNTKESNLKTLINGKEKWDEIDYMKKDSETLETLKSDFPEYYGELHKKTYPNLKG